MPDTWQGRETQNSTRYQMVVIIMLLQNRNSFGIISPAFGCDLPIFVIHWSEPGAFDFFPMDGKVQIGSSHPERNNMWKQ